VRGVSRWLVPVALLLPLGAALAQPARKAPAAPRETAEVHMGKGYDALKNDRFAVAVTEFEAALKLDPRLSVRARFPLAVALFELRRPVEARRQFEIVGKETGRHPNVLYYLGRIDLDERKFDSAVKNFTEAAADPPFPDTAYYLGFACFKQGDLACAEKSLNDAARVNPHDARVSYQLGQVYRRQGREEDAQKALEQSSQQRQRDAAESKLRLDCAMKLDQGQRQAAHAVCEQLYDANDADKLTTLGTLYGQHGDPEAALKPLQRAAEISPQSPQMLYNLALVFFQLQRFAEARDALAPAAGRWPDVFQIVALYGKVLAQLGDDLPAYETLHRAHALNPQDSEAADLLYLSTLKLGYKTGESGQYADSQRYFEEAREMRPQEPEPHVGLAAVYSQTGRAAQAAAEQKLAERLSKSAPQ